MINILHVFLGVSALVWLLFTLYALWTALSLDAERIGSLPRRGKVVYWYGWVALWTMVGTTLLWLVGALGAMIIDLVTP